MKLEHLISLRTRRKAATATRKWPVDPSDRSKLLIRRRQQRKKYINIFDMGRFAGGADIAYFDHAVAENWFVNWNSPTTVTVDVNNTGGATLELTDYLLDTSHEDWPTTFYNFTEELDDYGVEVSGPTEYVAGEGLLLPEDVEDVGFVHTSFGLDTPYFSQFIGSVLSGTKITRLPDYDDDAVDLVFDRSADIFLAPALVAFSGAGFEPPSPGLEDFLYHITAHLGRAFPRSTTAGDADWADTWAHRTTIGSYPPGIANLNDVVAQSPLNFYTADVEYMSEAPGTYPIDGADISSSGIGAWPFMATKQLGVNSSNLWEGELRAAVRKHMPNDEYEWYFCWQTSFQSNLGPLI